MGARKQGLKPQNFQKNLANIFPGESGLFGADQGFSSPVGAFSGLMGTNSSTPRRHGGSGNWPERGLFWPD